MKRYLGWTSSLLLLVFSIVWSPPQVTGANLVLNGGFESPALTAADDWAAVFWSGDDAFPIPDWDWKPPVWQNGIYGEAYAILHPNGVATFPTIDGQSFMLLGSGWIEQAIPTLPGVKYTLSYDTRATWMQVTWLAVTVEGSGGPLLDTESYADGKSNWHYEHEIVADSTLTYLRFGVGDWTHNFPLLDNVRMDLAPIPEPGTYALWASLGLLSYAGWRRRARDA